MSKITRHVVMPCIVVIAFFAVASTPVALLGCRLRGIIALTIALCSGISALITAAIYANAKLKKEPNTPWWFLSSAILAVPVIGFVIMA